MASRLALITFIDGQGGGNYPSNELPGFPSFPSNALPGSQPGIDNSLPPGTVTLPVFPFDPTIDNSLPSTPSVPDQALPRPGKRYVVKYLACKGLILVPDNSLPPTAEPKA
jgi:hypothetical protein